MTKTCQLCGAPITNSNRVYCSKACALKCAGQGPRTHGLSNTPEWRAWKNMRRRYRCDWLKDYPRYGGRGIKVCARWDESFENFIADMGMKPGPGFTIERKDNDGDYTPENCKWATPAEQNSNKRNVYTPAEIEMMLSADATGAPLAPIAASLSTTEAAIKNKIWKLKRRRARDAFQKGEQA